MLRLHLVADVIMTMKNWYRTSQSGQPMRTVSEMASACNVSCFCHKIYFWAWGLAFRDDKNVGSPKKFSTKFSKYLLSKYLKKEMRCFQRLILPQFHKSLIIVKYHVAS